MGALKISKEILGDIIMNLSGKGYRVIGPTVRNGVIVFDDIAGIEQLPVGYGDNQSEGSYSLFMHERPYFFKFTNGPDSLRRFLAPPYQRLFSLGRTAKGFDIVPSEYEGRPFAFIGVRACDLKALHILDAVFDKDPFYQWNRENIFVLAVNCTSPSDNCFCRSMNAGPEVDSGFDLLITELEEGFYIDVGSKKGAMVTDGIQHEEPAASDAEEKKRLMEKAANAIKKSINTEGLPNLLYPEIENPAWANIAKHDLSCGNCTMVCPTCFCNTASDSSSLDGKAVTRTRCWDSCFSVSFAHVHGGNFRPSRMARYRQWMMHKLAYSIEQFGMYGCVGCGRCITWCPAGIDITEGFKIIRQNK